MIVRVRGDQRPVEVENIKIKRLTSVYETKG